MRWTQLHDYTLLMEVLTFEPWQFKCGSKERGDSWEITIQQLEHNNGKIDVDNVQAIELRKRSLETHKETEKRNKGQKLLKKSRNNSNETIAYLKEKNEIEVNIRKEELEIKKREVEAQVYTMQHILQQQNTLMQQQNNMMQAMM
nr:uncharacterized protein LOC124816785 [Hydra vulgaris]